jgi:hypothetical protein
LNCCTVALSINPLLYKCLSTTYNKAYPNNILVVPFIQSLLFYQLVIVIIFYFSIYCIIPILSFFSIVSNPLLIPLNKSCYCYNVPFDSRIFSNPIFEIVELPLISLSVFIEINLELFQHFSQEISMSISICLSVILSSFLDIFFKSSRCLCDVIQIFTDQYTSH